LKLSKTTVIKYLKQGLEIGWGNYNADLERKKNYHCIKVICLSNGEIFNSMKDAKIKYHIQGNGISQCCKNKQKTSGIDPDTKKPLRWMYYNEYMNTIILKGDNKTWI